MVKLLDLLTLDIHERLQVFAKYRTYTRAIGFGEYNSIPLTYRSTVARCSIDDAIRHIEEQDLSPDNISTNAYTRGHYGEERHRWYVVAYMTYERTDKREGLLELEFAPVYPDMFPEETNMVERNRCDSCDRQLEIDNRILSDRGKMPPA
jgi:hypothetical protein